MVSVITRFMGVGVLTCAFVLSSGAAFATSPATVVGQITCGADEATPAAHIAVMAQGVEVQTVTDETGHFMLTGLPVGQPITIEAVSDPQASVIVSRGAVVLGSGQTLDVGSMDLAVCGVPIAPQTDEEFTPVEH